MTVDRQETRERGDGMGKGPRAGTRTQDARSATALHVDTLPTRLSAPTPVLILTANFDLVLVIDF